MLSNLDVIIILLYWEFATYCLLNLKFLIYKAKGIIFFLLFFIRALRNLTHRVK